MIDDVVIYVTAILMTMNKQLIVESFSIEIFNLKLSLKCIADYYETIDKNYFQLPINDKASKTQPQANPNDYEYLCEDGTRRAVSDKACTWAQRPWQGYMGNSDVKTRLTRLQNRIEEFYEDGKKSGNKEAATKLWINENNLVVKKDKDVLPGDHLTRAQYIDVIERWIPLESNIR